MIWVVAWLVQAGTIAMPEWTKDLGRLSDDDRVKYSAVLGTCVCALFALSLVTGFMLIKSEAG